MRLNVPPTLKQSSLIDSHNLTAGSSINSASKLIKKSSKSFKQDGHSQFGQDVTNNQIMNINSKRQSKRLLSPDSGKLFQKKKSMDLDEDYKYSQASFLKRMPLFNQYQEQSNLSQIRLSQIPKKQADYREDFDQQELPPPLSSRIKRKSSSSQLQTSLDRSPEALMKGLKRLKSIDVINQESSSSQGNSLNSSKRMEQKANLISSLRKTNPGKNSQQKVLQPIQQYNKQKHGIAESSSSHSKTNQSSARLQRQIDELRNNNQIEVSEIQSERQVSNSNGSQKSCRTINLVEKISDNDKTPQLQNKNKIQQKLLQIQKSLRLNDDYSMWDGTQADKSINSVRKQSTRFQKQKDLNDSDKKMLSNINDRFQKMKQIKNGSNENIQSRNIQQNNAAKQLAMSKNQIPSSNLRSFPQKAIQTDPIRIEAIPEVNIKQIHNRYREQISALQKQNIKLQNQLNMTNDSVNCMEIMKNKFEEQNKLLSEKIRRLERILQKNQKQLAEWKQIAKQGKVEPSQNIKQNQVFKQKNTEWKQKQDKYLIRITQLEKQLQRVNYLLKSTVNQKDQTQQQQFKLSKNDKKYKQHIEKLHRYEQNLTRNMQGIKRQQQKIIQQWRVIDQFYSSISVRQTTYNEPYQFQTIQNYQSPQLNMNTVSFRGDEDHYFRDNDVASISEKVKAMRTQLASDTR